MVAHIAAVPPPLQKPRRRAGPLLSLLSSAVRLCSAHVHRCELSSTSQSSSPHPSQASSPSAALFGTCWSLSLFVPPCRAADRAEILSVETEWMMQIGTSCARAAVWALMLPFLWVVFKSGWLLAPGSAADTWFQVLAARIPAARAAQLAGRRSMRHAAWSMQRPHTHVRDGAR